MRITNADIPDLPGYELDPTNASAPWFWVGQREVDGAASPWSAAPVGSLYLALIASVAYLYVKTVNTGATTDWNVMLMSDPNAYVVNSLMDSETTYIDNLTVKGTLTAGDVVIDSGITSSRVSR